MQRFFGISIFWVIFMPSLQSITIYSLKDQKVFSAHHDTPLFNHFEIGTDGYLYIGAVNRIYVLSQNLKLLGNFSTGPISGCNTNNKVLISGGFFGGFFVCDSNTVFKCNKYRFGIEDNKWNKVEKVFGNMTHEHANVSIVAIQGNGKSLYIGTSYHNTLSTLPLLAVMNIFQEIPSFDNLIAYNADNTSNSNIINTKYRDTYMVNYIHAFGVFNQNYLYFLTTQRKSMEKESPLVSKLIRICDEDDDDVKYLWQRYSQIPIECKNDGFSYNELKAAHLGRSNLFGLFCNSQITKATSNKPRDPCALCVYSLKTINDKFVENIQNCFNGNGSRGFDSVLPKENQACIRENTIITSDFCSSNLNMPLDGNMPLTGSPIITFDTPVTAITTEDKLSPIITFDTPVTAEDKLISMLSTYIFVGTRTGHIKKILIKDENTVCEYANLVIDEGSPINSDLKVEGEYLYIMTETRLTRIPTGINQLNPLNCSQYEDYSVCIQATPKLCGWCLVKNECTSRCDCSYNKSTTWYSYDLLEYVGNITEGSNNYQIGLMDMLQISIKHSSPITDGISCKYTIQDSVLQTVGFLFDDKIELHKVLCPIPKEIGSLQLKSSDQADINTTLSIQIGSEVIEDNVMQNIRFFDCKTFTTMELCVMPTYQCHWFFEKKICIYKKNNIQKDAVIITFPKESGSTVLKFIIYGIFIILGIALIILLIYFILKRRAKKNQVDLGAQQREMEFMVR